jgi:CRP/FNR family transcriptional regulator, cyclic AMP receptor protein
MNYVVRNLDHADPGKKMMVESVLKDSRWLQRCKPSTLQWMLGNGHLHSLRRGEILKRRGEPVDHVALVINGVIEASATSYAGKRRIIDYFGRGEMINVAALMDQQGALHDFEARTDTLLLLVGRPFIENALLRDAEFLRSMLVLLSVRTRKTIRNLAEISLLTLRQRCAFTLLDLAEQFGTPENDGISIAMKLSQHELSEFLGCSRPTLNRELNLLERQGIIRIFYSRIFIVNKSELIKTTSDP